MSPSSTEKGRGAGLTVRAQKLYERVCSGEFYFAYDPRTPKAMQELVDAKLVSMDGRPVVIRLCYVPTEGYAPYRRERFETRATGESSK